MHHVLRHAPALTLVAVAAVFLTASAARAQEPKTPGETILIPGLSVVGEVDPTVAYAVSDLLSERLSRSNRFSVISGDDLRQMLDLESQRQLAGCDSDSCVAEIAGSLDADAVLFGRISRLGETLIVRVTFFDARKAVAVDRIVIKVNDEGELPEAIDLEVGRYLGEAPAAVAPAAPASGASFPFVGAGLSTIGASVVVGLVTAVATLGLTYLVFNPRVFKFNTDDLQNAQAAAIGSGLIGGVATVALGAVGTAMFVAGFVE